MRKRPVRARGTTRTRRARNFYLRGTQRIENARCAREGFKGFKAGRPVLARALIEISLSRFYYLGMDAVAHPRRIGAAAPALRINLPVFVAAIKGSPGYISRGPGFREHVRRATLFKRRSHRRRNDANQASGANERE